MKKQLEIIGISLLVLTILLSCASKPEKNLIDSFEENIDYFYQDSKVFTNQADIEKSKTISKTFFSKLIESDPSYSTFTIEKAEPYLGHNALKIVKDNKTHARISINGFKGMLIEFYADYAIKDSLMEFIFENMELNKARLISANPRSFEEEGKENYVTASVSLIPLEEGKQDMVYKTLPFFKMLLDNPSGKSFN